ncbi:MAG TPA: toll/interleukin-1 receptor domain-containing protein [Thermoanaerobaculia bacterium]|jgi:hypothetical protein|nr:toll/interleukin-1 receptor domain-containing protein [Thermoanaerobaculia bacterium]
MGGIFISYRRDDATGYVHALRDRLAARFGTNQIFMDIDSIEPGLDFVEVIESSVASCDVVLALIGKRWLQSQRLQDTRDFVRLEIQAALARRIRVIPVLLEGVEMPNAEELPDVLAPLSRRQAFEISNRHFSDDLNQLAELLGRILTDQGSKKMNTLLPHEALRKPAAITHIQRLKPPAQRLPEAQASPRQSLRHVASTIATILAWLVACGSVVLAIAESKFMLTHESTSKEDAAFFFFLAITALLLLSAMVFKARKSSLASGFFQLAGIWQFVSLIGMLSTLGLHNSFEDYLCLAIFSIGALAFFFLAYRYRPKTGSLEL